MFKKVAVDLARLGLQNVETSLLLGTVKGGGEIVQAETIHSRLIFSTTTKPLILYRISFLDIEIQHMGF